MVARIDLMYFYSASPAALRLLSQATIICPFCSACGEPQKTDKNGSNPAFNKKEDRGLTPILFLAAVAASDSHATLAVAGNDYMSLLLRLRRTAKDGQNGSNPA